MTRIRIERTLPASGEILVRTGERVGASRCIARIPVRGEIRVVNVAHILGLNHRDLSRVMVKKRGDRVEAGEILAARRGVLPFLHKPCRSPVAGRLAAIGYGWVAIEAEYGKGPAGGEGAEANTLDLLAFVTGQVSAITNHRSVTIETFGTYIVGACGVGGEGSGVLQVSVQDPTHMLTADDIGMGSNNAILVGGAGVSPETMDRASEMKVKGMIVGGMSASLHDLTPRPPFPIVATEGYGVLPMSPIVFDILKRLEGHEVSISGQMSDAWGNSGPTIIIPRTEFHGEDEGEFVADESPIETPQVGDWVRAVRHPLLGQVGQIVSLSPTPRVVPSGLSLPGAQVAFVDSEHPSSQHDTTSVQDLATLYPSGTLQFVPWLNLERIDWEAEN
jgi:hypothetical protein